MDASKGIRSPRIETLFKPKGHHKTHYFYVSVLNRCQSRTGSFVWQGLRPGEHDSLLMWCGPTDEDQTDDHIRKQMILNQAKPAGK